MKRRIFIQACLAALAVPLAAGGAVLEGALPTKRRGLSPEELDEFASLTIERFKEQEWKELSRQAVMYKGIEIDWIPPFTDTVSVDWKQA